jgi:hypothetical protein
MYELYISLLIASYHTNNRAIFGPDCLLFPVEYMVFCFVDRISLYDLDRRKKSGIGEKGDRLSTSLKFERWLRF